MQTLLRAKHSHAKTWKQKTNSSNERTGFSIQFHLSTHYKNSCFQFCSSLDLRVTRVASIDLSCFTMALRELCKKTGRCPVKALFFFPEEKLTGIAPTRLIVEKGLVLRERLTVTVNWQGKRVCAEILALNGKFRYSLHSFFTEHVQHVNRLRLSGRCATPKFSRLIRYIYRIICFNLRRRGCVELEGHRVVPAAPCHDSRRGKGVRKQNRNPWAAQENNGPYQPGKYIIHFLVQVNRGKWDKFSCLAQYKNVCQKNIKPSDLFYKVIVHWLMTWNKFTNTIFYGS